MLDYTLRRQSFSATSVGGTPCASLRDMAILLICWFGISTLFGLAILGAAARPMPRMDERDSLPEVETVLEHDVAVAAPGTMLGSGCRVA